VHIQCVLCLCHARMTLTFLMMRPSKKSLHQSRLVLTLVLHSHQTVLLSQVSGGVRQPNLMEKAAWMRKRDDEGGTALMKDLEMENAG